VSTAVTTVADLLQLLHRAQEKARCGQLVYREWRSTQANSSLSVAVTSAGMGEPHLRWSERGPFAPATTHWREMWFAWPDQMRVQMEEIGGPTLVAVRRGSRWSRWESTGGITHGDVASVRDVVNVPAMLKPMVFAPLAFVASVSLELVGGGVRARRPVVQVVARPHGAAGMEFHDALEVDGEHGIVLRRATYVNEECVHLLEAVRAKFGEECGPDIFMLDSRQPVVSSDRGIFDD
jgi:hypothetical protein